MNNFNVTWCDMESLQIWTCACVYYVTCESLEFTFDCSKTINVRHCKQCTEVFPNLVISVAMTLSLQTHTSE